MPTHEPLHCDAKTMCRFGRAIELGQSVLPRVTQRRLLVVLPAACVRVIGRL